jgi:4-hydroxy-4-methyl-2-oxoglutarate aldolase
MFKEMSMETFNLWAMFIVFIFAPFLSAQNADETVLRQGFNFIPTIEYSEAENTETLNLFEGLRVADVSDGMDRVGLANTGLVDPDILPLWKDTETYSHRITGIALTVRYVPTQRKNRPEPGEDFSEWEGNWYNTLSSETWTQIIRKGTVIVIDDGGPDVGSIGSFNILAWFKAGAVGVVTDAGSRDTDEITAEKVPLYLRFRTRGIRPGRNALESVNRPVVIGGVLVCPGDVVVADGDGVIVVPRKVAKDVALAARKILDTDKAGRKNLYESMGRPMDKSVE